MYTSLCSSISKITKIVMKAKQKCLPLVLQNILLACLAEVLLYLSE